jgi:hypothetical protein
MSGRKPRRPDGELQQPEFKGFHNAFTHSGPVVARSPNKGKGRKIGDEDDGDLFFGPTMAEQRVDVQMRRESPAKRDKGKGKGKGKEVDAQRKDEWEWDGVGTGFEDDDGGMMDVDEAEGAEGVEDTEVGEVPMDVDGDVEDGIMVEDGMDWGEEVRLTSSLVARILISARHSCGGSFSPTSHREPTR